MRAATQTAKAAVLGRLLASCIAQPDLSLGQLLAVATLVGTPERARRVELVDVDDEELARLVEEVCRG
jgi:hypothetical protein